MSHNRNPKPPYSPQFRQQMVELVAAGRKPSELAKEFGCHETSILSWVRRAAASVESTDRAAPREPPNQAGTGHTCKGYGLVCRKKRSDVHAIYTLE
jgi:transposase-like protein